MRHSAAVFTILALCVCSASPAPAAKPTAAQADAPAAADVLEYIRLFGYRQALETGAENQLASLIELAKLTQTDVAPAMLDLIHEELQAELKAASEESLNEMVAVFQRHLSREDVAYLIGVGRDPRMQRVVRLQPVISADMESIGERLAETVTAKAAPRIEERLKKLRGGQQL